ncbi:CHAT domain-containing protein [Plantactinospora endophytica]|uniref:CHAT domain-containing protein n=1 Tax=Plantactinospora endophytica TaxID=673535 RepID=A0ABQ4EG01_9ACTN|nr:CHAT domain-containing protein [Plantactinospora endophytica]GIG93196.1 CHAT domain-containing protein [Plantactinospora endophytica]
MSRSALHRITAILDEYERTGAPAVLLDTDLSEHERSLGAAVGDRGAGRTAARALARLHWYRYLLLPGLDGLRERHAAVELFRRHFRREPELVPEPLRDECRDGAPSEVDAFVTVLLSPQQADRVDRLWQRHRAGDGRALRMLVDLYREWLPYAARQRDWPGTLIEPALLTDLADALLTAAAHASDARRYDDALDTASKALAATPARDPHRLSRLTHRGRLFELYFDNGAGPKALELAVGQYRRAAQLGWHRRPTDLDAAVRFGAALCRLAEIPEKATVEVLLEATAVFRDAVTSSDPDDPELPARVRQLNEVANLLAGAVGVEPVRTILGAVQEPDGLDRLFRRAEELADRVAFDTSPQVRADRLDAALVLFAAVPAYDPVRPDALLLLGRAELDRWQSGGELDGAVWAATWAQAALDAAGPDHPLRREVLTLLAAAAGDAGLHGRSDEMVEVAVSAARAALELAEALPEARPTQLGVLADAYARAGRLAGDPGALDEAVRHQREAVSHTSPGQPVYPLRLMSLASMLVHRDALVPDDALLAEAVQANRDALAALPANDSRRVGFTYNLASSLSQHALRRKDPADLLAAEQIFQQALALLPAGHPDHPRIRSSIAEIRYQRFLVGGDVDALAEAVELARQALAETPTGHHWWPLRALILARAAAELADLGGPDADAARAEAIGTYAAIAASPVADPQARLDAERRQAELADEAADPVARLAALERAVQRIPSVISRSTAGRRRLDAIGRLGGLASEAAALAAAGQDPDAAVELLERGRGLLFNEALGIRTGGAELRTVDPQLAAELDRVDRELAEADAYTHIRKFTIEVERRSASGESLGKSTREWDPRTSWLPRTRELAAERDLLIARIRALPGFADLLRPPSLPALRERLRGLPVVVVNTSGDRGDALLVPAEPDRPVELVRLPELREAVVRRQVTRMYAAVLDATAPTVPFDRRAAAQADLLDVLAWLWDAVTGPVLDRIAPVHGPAPRIWWCPVGSLARLPLHAAGHHGAADRSRTVLDRTVSSYTPTLTALASAVAERSRPPADATATIVGVPAAAPLAALSEVRAEVEQVARFIPGSALLTGTEVALDAVEEQLRRHPIAHFACHAEADASVNAMLAGGLRLGGATLSPHLVRSYRLDRPELAFLSACSTAETHPTFTDEPLHLASAFQLAGFRGVIGTMWRTTDSARIAEAFYGTLTGGGTRPPETAAAAQALTDTVRAERDEFPSTPTRWAGYIHVGLNRALPPTPTASGPRR